MNMEAGTKITPENLSLLPVGAKVSVPGRRTPVQVKKVVETETGVVVSTTSGRVRPGHRSGGAIVFFRGTSNANMFYWQPTINQNAIHDPEIEVVSCDA